MIDKIKIKNFKNIKDLTIGLDYVNVLIGANNAGKSSICQAIQFSISVAQTTTFEKTKLNRQKNLLSTSLTPEQLIYSPLKDAYALGYGGVLKEDRTEGIQINFFEKESDRNSKVLVRRGRNKNIATEIHNPDMGNELRSLSNPYSVYVPGLAGIPSVEEFKSPGIITRAAARGDANNYFRNILYLLSQNQIKWDKFTNDLNFIFDNIELHIDFNFQSDEHINVFIEIDNKSYPIDAAGTGVLQAVQILAYINLYKPKILILDEPDAHLHPNNQRKLAEKLLDLAIDEEFQIILSTHSRHLLYTYEGLAKINWVSNGKIIEEDDSIINVLLDIGALDKGDFLRNSRIKLIILTEDRNTSPLESIIKASGFEKDTFEFWSYEGCSDIKTANVLAAFIKKNAPQIKIALHRDRDYLEQDELDEIFSNLKDDVDYPFVTKGSDIESNFLNEKHISSIFPEITENESQQLIEEAIEKAKNKSFSKLLNYLTDKSLRNKLGHKASQNAELANKLLEEEPRLYSHGKTVLGQLKKLIQNKIKRNPNIFQESEHISSPIFIRAKQAIASG